MNANVFYQRRKKVLCRKDMIEYIKERLAEADDYTVEQIFDFLQEIMY